LPDIRLGQTRALLLILPRMKTHIFLKGFAALILFAPLSAMAEDDSPLAKQMEALNDAYKGFRKEKDAAKGAVQAREAQLALARGFQETPPMLAKMPDGPEKTKAAAQYRAMMAATLVKLCEKCATKATTSSWKTRSDARRRTHSITTLVPGFTLE
jgi:hypothetical protein